MATGKIIVPLSNDYYLAYAKAEIMVNGVVAKTLSVQAAHRNGKYQNTTLPLSYDLAKTWKVRVTFLNDAYAGSASKDRNLYSKRPSCGNMVISGPDGETVLWGTGEYVEYTLSPAVVVPAPPPPPPVPTLAVTAFQLVAGNTGLVAQTSGPVGSVVFEIDGQPWRTESATPYSLGGDDGAGNYGGVVLPPGPHTLKATPYSLANGLGTAGKALSTPISMDPNMPTWLSLTSSTPSTPQTPTPPIITPPPDPQPPTGGVYDSRQPITPLRTVDVSTLGMKALSTPVTLMAQGSNLCNVGSTAGFSVGDPVIVECGGESGQGLRNTMGVGGQWSPLGSGGYYMQFPVPKAMMTTIAAINSSTQFRLNANAATQTTNTKLYFDNGPKWDALNPTVAVSSRNGTLYQFGEGIYAFGNMGGQRNRMHIGFANDVTIAGASRDTTELVSPYGCNQLDVRREPGGSGLGMRPVVRDLHINGNQTLTRYGQWGDSGDDQPNAVTLLGSDVCGAIVQDLKITNCFRHVTNQYGTRGNLIRRIVWRQDHQRGEYAQWMYSANDCTDAANPVIFEDVVGSCPYLIKAFETFSSKGTIFRRCGGVNAICSSNTSGGGGWYQTTIRYTADSYRLGDVNIGEAVWLWMNTNIGDIPAAAYRMANVSSVEIRDTAITFEGPVASNGAIFNLEITDTQPDTLITNMAFVLQGSGYASGLNAVNSYPLGANTTVIDNLVITGPAGIYNKGTTKNSTVPGGQTIYTRVNGGGNTGTVVLI